MKKIFVLFFMVLVLLSTSQICLAQVNNISIDEIINEIPEVWWEGGWNKTLELNQFINNNLQNKQQCAKAQYWIACNHYANRDYKRAIDEFNIVLEQYSGSWGECVKAQFEIAQIYLYKLKEYEKALTAYNKVLSNYPDQKNLPAQSQRMIAYTYNRMKNNEKAYDEYKKVWENYSESKLEVTKAYWETAEMISSGCYKQDLTEEEKKQKLEGSLSLYKKAYIYCPVDEVEVMEWIIDSVVRTFKFLDGNSKRANAFINFQIQDKSNNDSLLSEESEIYDPLKDF
ncbi:MAG: tetratricopeptide repeat protein [Candidatus Aureabacteria bacterium]|nr:tetratricopeptide repeat protein [Candidatus Auribacterota bacterium]